jgi:hypothetical protein
VVDAVNKCPQLAFYFSRDHEQQEQILIEFCTKSDRCFCCCIGCINGMLLWIKKPTETNCEIAGVKAKKFFCGRKKKFGLNFQGDCDTKGHFLDVYIGHPGSTSDYFSFCTSSLKYKLERPGFLKAGKCLFGDNAYVNTEYMATPFKAVYSGVKNEYNFYHSQLQITVECAFGMLVKRWDILQRAIPNSMGLRKTTALAMCLCHLHNYCINQRIASEPSLCSNNFNVKIYGSISAEGTPALMTDAGNYFCQRCWGETTFSHELLGREKHFNGIPQNKRRRVEQQACVLSREELLLQVTHKGLKHPTPNAWWKQLT